MRLSSSLGVAIFLGQVIASPLLEVRDTTDATLEKRVIGNSAGARGSNLASGLGSGGLWTCGSGSGSVAWSSSAVEKHAVAASEYLPPRGSSRASGPNNYPHVYKNYEGLNMNGCSGTLWEWPLTSNPYSGGAPGADRVIISPNYANDVVVVCAVITHRGAANRNGFTACTI